MEFPKINLRFLLDHDDPGYTGSRKEALDMDQIKVGRFIASCRKEQGMTQAVLAEKLGISDRAVSKWETGKSMPDSGWIV